MFKIFSRLTCVAAFLLFTTSVSAQGGNTVGGHVFGDQRLPLEGITVELLDDFYRTIGRVRTDSTGRFFFARIAPGRYRVRVMPLGTNYQEQEQEIEIRNFLRSDSRGNTMLTGFEAAQADFYLRVPKDRSTLSNDTIFAQSIPEPAQKLFDEAMDLLRQKKTEEAYARLRSAIETFPDYFLALEVLGLEYINADHFQAAQILLQRALQLNPKSFKGWYGLSVAFNSQGMEKEALEAAKMALNVNPSSPDAMLLNGTLLRQTGDYKASVEILEKLKKTGKNPNPDVYWQLALVYGNNLHKYKEAADELEQFLKYLPKGKDPEKIKLLIKTFREKSKQA